MNLFNFYVQKCKELEHECFNARHKVEELENTLEEMGSKLGKYAN